MVLTKYIPKKGFARFPGLSHRAAILGTFFISPLRLDPRPTKGAALLAGLFAGKHSAWGYDVNLTTKQVQDLAVLFTSPEPGDPPRDPQALGDPLRWGPYALAVDALQHGRDPIKDVLPLLPQDLQAALWQADPSGKPAAPPLQTLSAYTILTTDWPEPVWAIPHYLPVGLTLFAGRAKLGKSFLALQIAQSVVTGGVALGEQAAKGPVLFLALEDSPRRLKDRMQGQAWLPLQRQEADFMCLGDFDKQIGPLSDPAGVAKLALQMQARQYRLVVIDTLSRAFRGDQNDADTMARALSPLQSLALSMNCALVVIDHHKKKDQGESDPILDVSGSVAKVGIADAIWGLYREQGKAGVILHILGRDLDEKQAHLTFDPFTLCWQNDGDPQAAKMSEARQDILDALRVKGGKGTLAQVAKETGKDKGNLSRQLKDMVNDGLLRLANGIYEIV